MLMLTLFMVAIVLRFITITNEIGRILLAFDLFIFYFRLLHVFTISESLGPKVIMIFKMVCVVVNSLGVYMGLQTCTRFVIPLQSLSTFCFAYPEISMIRVELIHQKLEKFSPYEA